MRFNSADDYGKEICLEKLDCVNDLVMYIICFASYFPALVSYMLALV